MINHLSASQIVMYRRCPAQWFFRYVDGLIIPPTSALLVGQSFHASHRTNFIQKVESHQDLPTEDILDVFSTQYDEGSHDVEWVDGEDKGNVKDIGIRIVKHYHESRSPAIQPIEVEKEFELSVKVSDESFGFKGYIDIVTETHTLELKTTSRRPSGVDEDHKLQVVSYEVGLMSKGQSKGRAVLDYAVKKTVPEVVSIDVPIGTVEIKHLLCLIPLVYAGIKAGISIPNRGNKIICNKEHCGYWRICHSRYGG